MIERTKLPGSLADLDMSAKLSKSDYEESLQRLQANLNLLHRMAWELGLPTVAVFEGWDAGGKGGAIRRVTGALDARDYKVVSIAAPTEEETAHHYLWRFWKRLPRAGRWTIFDRSWYGRVLVERVEEFATMVEWKRSYDEINDFEEQLISHGIHVAKFWLHITPEEQAERFEARKQTPYKRWKLTEEDWRNRSKWTEYEDAVDEMVERTSTDRAPWALIAGNNKRYARIRVLEVLCAGLREALGRNGHIAGRLH